MIKASMKKNLSLLKNQYKAKGTIDGFNDVYNKINDNISFEDVDKKYPITTTGNDNKLGTSRRMTEPHREDIPIADMTEEELEYEGNYVSDPIAIPEGIDEIIFEHNAWTIKDQFIITDSDTGEELFNTKEFVDGIDFAKVDVSKSSNIQVTIISEDPELTGWNYRISGSVYTEEKIETGGGDGIKLYEEKK